MDKLHLAALPLLSEHRNDSTVVRFAHMCDTTLRAEKVSDPTTWTAHERHSYDAGDWMAFSHMRGYSEDEISEFAEYLKLAEVLDERYGMDFAASISYLVQEQTGILGQ